ncbi:MAG: sigma-54-dependent Fis family transcriptional regulator [Spirochaetales bacterium]|nr:sigma-54-dependent Fis family transcriptional regulator [Spirochaetales bacterium]
MQIGNILIVDDEKGIRDGLRLFLKREGHLTFTATDGQEALEILEKNDIDLVISDLKMPRINGDELLAFIKKDYPGIKVIILTGHGTVETAVESMRNGAYDFLIKPLNLDKLGLIVKRALSQRQLEIDNRNLKKKLNIFSGQMIGKSEKMIKIANLIEQVAPSKTSVLILGENGVGKEVIANLIHDSSNRKNNPFIKVHCAALSENLLESELFGHEKGAFTGAIKEKKGRFELADSGTIFLDEIGEISPNIQVKLLRVIQEKAFERVGGEETITVDVRIVAATNKNLKKEVEEGRFREDLYYRLNVVQITVPSLRERKEDILLMVSSFIQNFSKENGKEIKEITKKAQTALYNYDWPGNIRELKNVLEAAVVLSKDGIIDINDLPPYLKNDDEHGNFLKIKIPAPMAEIEKEAIISTLALANGNKSKTAEMLEMNRKTLYAKLNEFEILPPTVPENK